MPPNQAWLVLGSTLAVAAALVLWNSGADTRLAEVSLRADPPRAYADPLDTLIASALPGGGAVFFTSWGLPSAEEAHTLSRRLSALQTIDCVALTMPKRWQPQAEAWWQGDAWRDTVGPLVQAIYEEPPPVDPIGTPHPRRKTHAIVAHALLEGRDSAQRGKPVHLIGTDITGYWLSDVLPFVHHQIREVSQSVRELVATPACARVAVVMDGRASRKHAPTTIDEVKAVQAMGVPVLTLHTSMANADVLDAPYTTRPDGTVQVPLAPTTPPPQP